MKELKDYEVFIQYGTQRQGWTICITVCAYNEEQAEIKAMGYLVRNEFKGKGRYLKFDKVVTHVVQ